MNTGIAICNGGTVSIQENTLKNHNIGILLHGGAITYITNNNLLNDGYSVYSSMSTNLNATNNWWETTDTQTINQTIYDYKNDFNLGTVTFVPFLTASNPQVPSLNTQQLTHQSRHRC
jgi:hypothetical protein